MVSTRIIRAAFASILVLLAMSFIPATARADSKKYKRSVEKYSMPDEISYSFHTPYLNLVSSGLFWAKNDNNKNITELRTELVFNAKVNPADLRNLLHVKINGKEENYVLNSSNTSDKITIAIPEMMQEILSVTAFLALAWWLKQKAMK